VSGTIEAVAFYLPQYHPIPENDEWWGKGFTEWTNTVKAKPLYRGHYQPHLPADLGFYDLRLPEARAAQAAMAREHGISAFCYYHYWFAGKRLLERPIDDVLSSNQPDLPFCLCWANQTWTGVWHGAPNRILIEQTYPGPDDHRSHFALLLRAFSDSRYFCVDGKPLFMVYEPTAIPDILRVTDLWRELAHRSGLKGLHLVAWQHGNNGFVPSDSGFDASVTASLPRTWPKRDTLAAKVQRYIRRKRGKPTVYQYEQVLYDILSLEPTSFPHYPCVIPNWDNTPRSGANGLVLHESTPELFRKQLVRALESLSVNVATPPIVFIKSWNEWAEGNHLEPDQRFGRAYLDVVKDELHRANFSRSL
jgi:hypothetical protein